MNRKVDHKIIPAKKKLRKLSKDFKQNFKNIENYIKKEIYKIKRLKKLSKNIIPEIKYKELLSPDLRINDQIKKRGCIIIRDVFDQKKIGKLNNDLEKYIEHNGYYNDQKKKEGLDKYFSDLKSGKPQIYGLYWSKAQIKIRHSQKMAKIKKFLWSNGQNSGAARHTFQKFYEFVLKIASF